jgi:hypothetical protein
MAGEPAELAPAYVILPSEDGQSVNGEILGVTGGKPLAREARLAKKCHAPACSRHLR